MSPKTTRKRATDAIDAYAKGQSPNDAAICHALRAEIDAALPGATSKIWHGSPVWFVGENPVVGYDVRATHVTLLFWSGQSFGEPALRSAGKFAAAQTQFTAVAEIDREALRRWLKKAGTQIWDYQGHFKRQLALRKKAKK